MPGRNRKERQTTRLFAKLRNNTKGKVAKKPEGNRKIIKSPCAEHLIINGLVQHELKHN
jgi:hypothetical protein